MQSPSRTAAYEKDPAYERVLESLNASLAQVPLAADAPSVPRRPLLFVVGLPRSGTTLAHQLLARTGALGYVSNVIARFAAQPAFGARVQQALTAFLPPRAIQLSSRAGNTDEWNGPHEFTYFWRRHLPLAEHEQPSEAALDSVAHEDLAAQLGALEDALGRPMVFKNLVLDFALRRLAQWLPTARFLWVRRDSIAVADSIRRMRVEFQGDVQPWWSIRPADFQDFADAAPEKQIAHQMAAMSQELGQVKAELGAARWRDLDYTQLCADPRGCIQSVLEFMGVDEDPGNMTGLPERLDSRVTGAVSEDIRSALAERGLV